jgi:hypothetical protein
MSDKETKRMEQEKNQINAEREYPKQSYRLFFAWMIGYVILLMAYPLSGWNAPIGDGKVVGILTLAALDILFLLMWATQRIYWISGITYEAAEKAGPQARKAYARRHLTVFLVVTVLYLIYSFALPVNTTVIWDSLIAGALVCVAVLATMRIHL